MNDTPKMVYCSTNIDVTGNTGSYKEENQGCSLKVLPGDDITITVTNVPVGKLYIKKVIDNYCKELKNDTFIVEAVSAGDAGSSINTEVALQHNETSSVMLNDTPKMVYCSTQLEYGEPGKVMSARELARIIKHAPAYNGEKIRLLSCSTGATDDGFAQDLANALGVEVEAPNDVLIVAPNGKFEIGYDGSGEMVTVKPGNKGRE